MKITINKIIAEERIKQIALQEFKELTSEKSLNHNIEEDYLILKYLEGEIELSDKSNIYDIDHTKHIFHDKMIQEFKVKKIV